MCGIFGIWNTPKAAELTVIGLHGNQHRAKDYAGMVSTDGSHFYRERGTGIARQAFMKEKIDLLHGWATLGHIRYPTVNDDPTRDNTQPIMGTYDGTPIAIAHNGNLTNVAELAALLPGCKMSTSMDTEYILRLLEQRATGDLEADLASVFALLRGSFALGILRGDRLMAARDGRGNRPLSIARINGGYCISSETCVFANLAATHVCDVDPGTLVSISSAGLKVTRFAPVAMKKCRFEGIYFSHPSSDTFGEPVGRFRTRLGKALEEHAPIRGGADIVTPIPDSSNFIALGFAESRRSGAFLPVIMRNHYAGRTFIAATQAMRDAEVSQKFTFTASEIKGRRIVVVDDSIVRGTTLPKIIRALRQLGAAAVHVRIGSPPITHPCTYGINTPTRTELVGARLSPTEMCEEMGADSLEFLPLEILKALSPDPESFCFSCMTGQYW